MAITIFTRNSAELLIAFDKATVVNPLMLMSNEIDILHKGLKERNGSIKERDFACNSNLWDKGISFKNEPIFSHVDGKRYSNRAAWDQHLKQNSCIEVGNDKSYQTRKREVRGNFNCRKELSQAVEQVLSRSH